MFDTGEADKEKCEIAILNAIASAIDKELPKLKLFAAHEAVAKAAEKLIANIHRPNNRSASVQVTEQANLEQALAALRKAGE